jgi:hypothetical protein
MNTAGFKVNDKCNVVIDWGDGAHNGKRVQILGFERHGQKVFARIVWLGSESKALAEQYSTIFGLEEIRHV